MSNAEPVAIGLGEILWDLLPSGRQLGGAPANFAYHAQALGARGAVVSAVGADAPGAEILARLRGLEVDARYVAVDAAHPTGTVTVQLDAAGIPTYVIHEGVAWDHIPATPAALELAGRAAVTCFGTLAQRSPESRAAVHAFLAATPKASLRILDVNLRQSYYDVEVIRASLQAANILKLNDSEMPVLAKLLRLPADEERAITLLLRKFALRVIAVTRGAKGSTLYSAGAVSHHGGFPPAELADTVGAGDAFTAALAMGLIRGHDLDRINAGANRLAAHVCAHAGATPIVPRSLIAAM